MSREQFVRWLGIGTVIITAFLAEAATLDSKWIAGLMLAGAVMAAVSGAISRTIALPVWVTALGVIGAGATVFATAQDWIGTRWAWVAGLISAGAAAIGKSLWPSVFGGSESVPPELKVSDQWKL